MFVSAEAALLLLISTAAFASKTLNRATDFVTYHIICVSEQEILIVTLLMFFQAQRALGNMETVTGIEEVSLIAPSVKLVPTPSYYTSLNNIIVSWEQNCFKVNDLMIGYRQVCCKQNRQRYRFHICNNEGVKLSFTNTFL